MIRPLVIAQEFEEPLITNGQLERIFFKGLPGEYKPLVVCKKAKLTESGVIATRQSFLVRVFQSFNEHTGLLGGISLPDRERLAWNPQTWSKIKKLFKKDTFDYVHTINMPCSSHLLGYKVKMKYGIPWVAQFYDPWHDNPNRIHRSAKLDKFDASLEALVANYADVIIMPNDSLKDSWEERYGAGVVQKIVIIPFIADTKQVVLSERKNNGQLIISHIGGLTKKRNAGVFLQGLYLCVKEHPEYLGKLKVNFIGAITDIETSFIKDAGLEDYVTIVGRIPEQECKKYYEESDLFLIVDLNVQPNVFYPSKIIKYFCYQKPIIGLVTKQSTIRDELNKTGNYAFEYNDADGVAAFLAKAIEDYPSICTNDREYWKRFSKEHVLSAYDAIVKKMLKK